MNITWRFAVPADSPVLADWNYRLIRDEGHRNAMTVAQLTTRMSGWLEGEYRAVVFDANQQSIGYALYRQDADSIYLRQFFIQPEKRRQGFGRMAMSILIGNLWPKDIRLTVDVLCQNKVGIAFWRAIGYQDYCLTLEMMQNQKLA